MRAVSNIQYNVSEIIGLLITILLYKYVMESCSIRERILKHIYPYVLMEIGVIILISILSYYWIEYRYFLIVVVWSTIKDVSRSLLTHCHNELMQKEELTNFKMRNARYDLTGSLLGFITVVLLENSSSYVLPLGSALTLQVGAVLIVNALLVLWVKQMRA